MSRNLISQNLPGNPFLPRMPKTQHDAPPLEFDLFGGPEEGRALANLNVLLLCSGNSARSIMAEALFNTYGKGRVNAYSAGSRPKGEVHPMTLSVLQRHGHKTRRFRSKSWDEFSLIGAPRLGLVITLCDGVADMKSPVWPGAYQRAHWAVKDPTGVEGFGQRAAFEHTYMQIKTRLNAFLRLPFEDMPASELQASLNEIGCIDDGLNALDDALHQIAV